MKKKLFLLATLVLAALPVYADQASQGRAAAESAASSMAGYSGTAGSFIQNVGNPMTGGGLMYTVNTQKSFNARISCPSSQHFLEVMIQPSGTGDLGTVYVAHDNNYDGSYDYTLSLPFVVSGVCSNGIITCNPGTWNNCIPMQWYMDDDKKVNLKNVSWSVLGGCYCINNSCGASLAWNNKDTILKDLGAGIVAAIQQKDSRASISGAKVQNYSISYYGQNTKNCSATGSYSGLGDPTFLYGNWGKTDALMVAQRDSEVQAQSLDPGSYYSLLKTSAATNKMNKSQCTIKREIYLDPINVCSGGGSYDSSRGKCWIALEWHTEVPTYTYVNKVMICPSACVGAYGPWFNTVQNKWICSCYNNTLQMDVMQECPVGTTTEGELCRSAAICSGYGTYNAGSGLCDVPGCTTGYTLTYDSTTGLNCLADSIPDDQVYETINNQCQAFENDVDCHIVEEKVDNVQTVINGSPTFLSPMESCKTFTGNKIHSLCRQWWVKTRSYSCQKNAASYDNIKERLKKIHSTTSGNATGFTYSDIRYNGSSWVTETTSTSGIKGLSFDINSCEKACKMSRAVADTRAAQIGMAQELQSSTTRYEYVYRSCTQTGTCTVQSGETLVKGCQCINEYAEALTIFAVMNSASGDAICSSGVKK